MRVLAVTGSQRVSALPDVPTLAETVAPGFNSISWIGLLAPAGTPAAIVEKIAVDVRETIASTDVKTRLTELGAIPHSTSPSEFAQIIESDRKRYATIIRDRGITVD